MEQLICVGKYTLSQIAKPLENCNTCSKIIVHIDRKICMQVFFWWMIIRVLHRFDIIGLGPDSPEDEEGIKASSEICKFLGGF